MNRRSFMAAILVAGVAPAVVKIANLMPLRLTDGSRIILPDEFTATERYSVGWADARGVFGSKALWPGLERWYADNYDKYALQFSEVMRDTKARTAFDVLTK